MNRFEAKILVVFFFTRAFGAKLVDYTDDVTTMGYREIEDIATCQMFIDGTVKSLKKLLDENPDIRDMDELLSLRPDAMYTALECKYADHIIDVLQTIYSIIVRVLPDSRTSGSNFKADSSSVSAVVAITDGEFNDMKTLFAKMIYNLFYHSDRNKRLRTCDQGLLKTFLSVHRFLHFRQKTLMNSLVENVKKATFAPVESEGSRAEVKTSKTMINGLLVLNNTIVQTIGLIECFRCKHCIVRDPYVNYVKISKEFDRLPTKSIDDFRDVLKSKLKSFYSIIRRGPVNYVKNKYHESMYDPDNLLLKYLLEFHHSVIGNAKIEIGIGRFVRLEVVYEITNNTYNIDSILKYQIYLFEVIGHIFARQLNRLFKNQEIHYRIQDIRKLKDSLNAFVRKILPSNCLSFVSDFLFEMDHFLTIQFDNYDSSNPPKKDDLDNMMIHLQNKYEGKFWASDDDLRNVYDLPLHELVSLILENKFFLSFQQVTKLLSYESNTNRDHQIINVFEIPRNLMASHKYKLAVYMCDLRYALFSFWIAIFPTYVSSYDGESMSLNSLSTTETVRNLFFCTTSYLINFHNKITSQHRSARNILMPLFLQLRHINQSLDKMNVLERLRLEHVLIYTINIIENYSFKKFKKPTRSMDIYATNFLDKDKMVVEVDLSGIAFKSVWKFALPIDETDIDQSLNTVYRDLFFQDELSHFHEDNILFYWNGVATSLHNVHRELPSSIVGLQDLIRYRLLIIKWFVAKILLKLYYVLIFYDRVLQSDRKGESIRARLIECLNNFDSSYLSVYTGSFVARIANVLRSALVDNQSVVERFRVEYFISVIESRLFSLGVVQTEDVPDETVQSILASVKTDIDEFQNIYLRLKSEESRLFSRKMLRFSTSLIPI